MQVACLHRFNIVRTLQESPPIPVWLLSSNPVSSRISLTTTLCVLYFICYRSWPIDTSISADVRMRYQNKNMILPICSQDGDHLEGHPEFCTLEAFQARVKELTPEDWDAECLPGGKA